MNVIQFMLHNRSQVLELTLEHLWLVGWSTFMAALIGIPLGILIAHRMRFNKPILAGATLSRRSRALHYLDFYCRCRGWANGWTGWRFWR